MKVRGYAIPFDRRAFIPHMGRHEVVARNAFDALIAAGSRPLVQFGSHEGYATKMGNASIFVDDVGLGFSVDYDEDDAWQISRAIAQGGYSFASVEFAATSRRTGWVENQPVSVVRWATLKHIAITDARACYRTTAVWLAGGPLDHAPDRVRAASKAWLAGRMSAKAREHCL